MEMFWLLVAMAFGLLVYLAPAYIAASRKHHQTVAIVALDVLLGWALTVTTPQRREGR